MKRLIYVQVTGVVRLAASPEDTAPVRLGVGYSGRPPYVNDREAEAMVSRGPIPRGHYRTIGPFDNQRLGPVVWFLTPSRETQMFGRSGFFIHGDNEFQNRTASAGCIVLQRPVRDRLVAAGPFDLEVI